METLTFHGGSINSRHISKAVNILLESGIIIYPTDTLYALGCDALNNKAVERLCHIKGINPEKQTLSIICSGISQASDYAKIDDRSFRILKNNLPGPFTFILPASPRLPKIFKGRKSVGIRIPDNEIAIALADTLGHPILSTSVEISEEDEATDPASIAMHYAGIADAILDAGYGNLTPSAIVDLIDSDSPEILREGPQPLN